MKTAALKGLLVAFAVAALAACTIQPIYNVKGAPVETPGGKPPTLAEVEKAIVRAGSALGWKMQPVRPGVMVGTLNLRSHTAIVDVTFDTRTFNITYKDSVEPELRRHQHPPQLQRLDPEPGQGHPGPAAQPVALRAAPRPPPASARRR